MTELPKFFLEGLASVVAPCVLPLLPTYLAAIAAVDAERLGERRAATRVLRATVPFLLGLATVFVGLGLGVGALTSSGIADRQTIDEVAGILLVVLGLSFMGLLPWPERIVGGGLLLRARDSGSRLLLGAAFAVCAAPCVGPLLAARAHGRGARPERRPRRRRPRGLLRRARHRVPRRGLPLRADDGRAALRARPLPRAQAVGGAALVAFGLLLFFHRDWWLRAAFNDTLQALGLDGLEPERGRARPPRRRCRAASTLGEQRRDVDAAVLRRVRREPPLRLLELARRRDRLAATRLVPRDGDVDEPLEEVPLLGGRGAPREPPAPRARRSSAPARISSRPVGERILGIHAAQCYAPAVATILLVGVDLFFRGKLEGLLPGHQLSASDSVDAPDLVIADIARVDPQEVADSWPDVPILGYTNHTDTAGLRAAHAAGLRPGRRQERPRRAGTCARRRTAPVKISRRMTYVIAEPCIDIKDRSCIDVCPVDCIHETERMLVIDPEECIDCGACEPECPVEAIFPEDALPDKWEPFVKINAAWTEGEAAVNALANAYATEHNVQNEPLD